MTKTIFFLCSTLVLSLFGAACNTDQQPVAATDDPYAFNANSANMADLADQELTDDEYWAKDNFDLQRVGSVLERAESPQQFETYLNSDDGINNLDLNGDGYVDYISVDEFGDVRGERGLSLYSRYGPDMGQEIATVYFYRDDYNSPGARILIDGNDQIYGNNYYYETNWLDRTIGLVTALFTDRDDYYRSPYYYGNYPPGYTTYDVVAPTYYRTRVVELYPEPAFVYLTAPPAYYSAIKIKSPNNGLHLGQIKARLVNPTAEQAVFLKNNPPRRGFAKAGKPDKPGKPDDVGGPPRSDDDGRGGPPDRSKQGNPNAGRGDDKGGKPDDRGRGKPDDKGVGKGQGQGQGQGQGKGKGKP